MILLRSFLHPFCALVALVLVAGLFIGGSQPFAVGLFTSPWDKLAHASVFAVLASLLAVAFKGAHLLLGRDALSKGKAILLSASLAVLVAGADEIHQIWLPGRVAAWDDWIADVVGIALALAVVRWLWRRHAGKVLD